MTTAPQLAQLATQQVPLDALHTSPRNPRRGNVIAIAESLNANGQYRPIVARDTGEILAGNHTYLAAQHLGWDTIAAVILDVDDATATRIMLADNRTAELGGYDDDALLTLLAAVAEVDAELIGTGYTADDLALLTQPAPNPGDRYTRKTDVIQYEPTEPEAPPVPELLDRTKTTELLSQIGTADLPADVRDFLTAAAQRHLVFNYARIAEFYAHAEPAVQRLMEASALVIVDFDDAIHHGFVQLSSDMRTLLDLDLAERAALDGS